jgi:DNA-binding LytR/AlgR family response regulator
MRTMKIAAVDDDVHFLDTLSNLVAQSPYGKEVNLVTFTSSKTFLLADLATFDAFILDIYIDAETGLSLAKILKKELKEPWIVFLTSAEDQAVEAFELGAVHYLLKPVEPKGLNEALRRIEEGVKAKDKRIVLENKTGFQRILLRNILYIESFGNVKDFKTTEGVISIRKSTEEVLSLLAGDPRFFALSRSYIVNFDFVRSLKGEGLLLSSGETLPVPREKKKAVMAAFLTYLGS